MSSSALRHCPYCHQKWPKGTDYHDLRAARWLDPLPRNITVSNGDLLLHDGYHGHDRFLLLETKMPWETIQAGQATLLAAVARQERWTVRVLRGRLPNVDLHRVTPAGVDREPISVPITGVQTSVVDWINGDRWEDPRASGDVPLGTPLTAPRPCPSCHLEHPVGTTCEGGWAPWRPAA